MYDALQDGWGRWQLGFHALFTMAANCPNLKELTISEEHLEVSLPITPLNGVPDSSCSDRARGAGSGGGRGWGWAGGRGRGRGKGKGDGEGKETAKAKGDGKCLCLKHHVMCAKTTSPLMACLPFVSTLYHAVHALNVPCQLTDPSQKSCMCIAGGCGG